VLREIVASLDLARLQEMTEASLSTSDDLKVLTA
jgi:hypothetical protein